MDELQTTEGTREEVSEQLQHFPKDQRFRLIALPRPQAREDVDVQTMAEQLEGTDDRNAFVSAVRRGVEVVA
jgi:hypothetical protein